MIIREHENMNMTTLDFENCLVLTTNDFAIKVESGTNCENTLNFKNLIVKNINGTIYEDVRKIEKGKGFVFWLVKKLLKLKGVNF